jgi:carbon storage regulator CsrA
VTVLDVRGGNVRLGVIAPADVAVFRNEVWERMQAAETGGVPSPPS